MSDPNIIVIVGYIAGVATVLSALGFGYWWRYR